MSGGDLDVSMRLRLINDVSKEAKKVKEDLKDLDKAVDKLGKGGNSALDRNIANLGKRARESVSAVKSLETEVKKLDAINTNKVEGEIKSVAKTSQVVGRTIGQVLKQAQADANMFNTEKAQAKFRELASQSKLAGRTIGEALAAAKAKANGITTDQSVAEIKEISTAAKEVMGDLNAIEGKLNRLDNPRTSRDARRPNSRVNTVASTVGDQTTGFFSGLLAYASIDNITLGLTKAAREARALQREVAAVAVTAEMRDPETVQMLGASNRKLALKYGLNQSQVNAARNTFVAAGVGVDSQEEILDPTIKAAKASSKDADNADPTAVAEAVIAAKQNLGLKDSEVPAYLDQLVKGTKLGSFEVDAVARNFPKLAALYQQTGRDGLDATSELIAFAQIARKTAGTPDQASTNMENILGKIFAPDAQKNFKDKGVDLAKIRDRSLANDKPYLMSVVDEVMRITGGDTFKVSELFGDVQAKNALQALIANRKLYDDWQNQIRNDSSGAVDTDYNFLKKTPAEANARRGQALDAHLQDMGTYLWDNIIEPSWDRIVRSGSPEYDQQRRDEDLPESLKENALQRLDLENEVLSLTGQKGRSGGLMDGEIDTSIAALQMQIERLKAEETDFLTEQRRKNPDKAVTTTDGNLGKSTGKIPVPIDRPVEAAIGKDMSGAAEESMSGYNAALKAAGRQAESIAAGIAATLKSILSFTATPTISPNMVNPGNSTAKVPGKQSSLATPSSTKVTQNITTPSAIRAARLAQREQDRAVRMARSSAYSDMGSMPA